MNVGREKVARTQRPRRGTRSRVALAGVTTAALSLPGVGAASALPVGQPDQPAQGSFDDDPLARTDEYFRRCFEISPGRHESFESFLDRLFKQRPSTWSDTPGRIHRKWKLGVEVQGLSEEMARSLGMDEVSGVAVTRILEDSPAQRAGVLAGDVITSLNAETISSPEELVRQVQHAAPGDSLELGIWRRGEGVRLRAQIPDSGAERTVDAAKPSSGKIGVHLVSITDESRTKYRLADDVEGALVIGTVPGSPAFEMGVRAGDVIAMVGQTKVASPEDVVTEINDAVRDHRDSVLVLVERDGVRRFVPVELG